MKDLRLNLLLAIGWLIVFAVAATICGKIFLTPRRSKPDFPRAEKSARELDTHSLEKISSLIVGSNANYKLQFINPQEGWFSIDHELWGTTNGGKTWKSLYSGQPTWHKETTIEQLCFITSQIGWILVPPGSIYRTEDGGQTWMQQASPFPHGTVNSIRFSKDGKQGWAAGSEDISQNRSNRYPPRYGYPVISYTVDGGQTWQGKQIIHDTDQLSDFYFSDETHGWALGVPGLFYLDKRTNRWMQVSFKNVGCANQRLLNTIDGQLSGAGMAYSTAALFFLNKLHGWISFQNGFMASTTDGGKHWCDLLDPRSVWPTQSWDTYFSKIYFVDEMNGWGLANDTLYKTPDGGKSWERIDIESKFSDMYFLDYKYGWTIGPQGLYRINP